MQTREVLDAMRSDADLSQLKLLRVDGGASYNALLMQLQADILQVHLLPPSPTLLAFRQLCLYKRRTFLYSGQWKRLW